MNQILSPWNLFAESLKKYPERPCIFYGNEQYTYSNTNDKIDDFLQLLMNCNFNTAGIYLGNIPEYIFTLLALNRANKISVFISSQHKGASLLNALCYADIEILITDMSGYKNYLEIQEQHKLKCIILCRDNTFELIRLNDNIEKSSLNGKNIFGICFTSGTTDKPKGVMIPNKSIAGNARAMAALLSFQPEDRFLLCRPLSQAGPLAGDLLMSLSRGASVVILKDIFHPAIFLKAVQDFKVTSVMVVNTMLNLILDYPRKSEYDIHTLKYFLFGGMVASPPIIRKAITEFPEIEFINIYGITENCTRVAAMRGEGLKRFPNSIGKTINGCIINIMDNKGNHLPDGQVGNIYIDSDYLMAGYYKYEKLNAQIFTPYGFKTGDIGYRDKEGNYFILSRNDGVIIQGGNNIYPSEIEGVLKLHPDVLDVAVIGIPDETLGQRIIAFISLKKAKELSKNEIFIWCRKNLEDKKLPKEVFFIHDIPKNISGKHSIKQLEELYLRREKKKT